MDLKHEKFNARNLAKYVANTIITATVSSLVKTAIPHDPDSKVQDTAVSIVGFGVGWYVADQLEPFTEKFLDAGFDKLHERRAMRNAKINP